MRRALLPLALLLLASLLAPPAAAQDGEGPDLDGRYRANGDAGGFFNIMPPGADGVLNGPELVAAAGDGTFPPHFNDQTAMYEQLVYEGGLPVDGEHGEALLGITDGDIERFFKDGSFGSDADVSPVDVSACGEDVVAFRDADFGVPHIFSTDRAQAQCANGYATAEDRLFLMDLLRHIGYARMSEFLGASDANQAMDRAQLLVAPYSEEDYVQQEADLCESADEELLQVCADGRAYIEGVNHYIAAAQQNPSLLPGEYVALQTAPEEFILRDILATASLVGGIFGKGGGNEAANSMFMQSLIQRHGDEQAREVFDDLKAANDPDASLTTQASFPYNNLSGSDPDSTVLLEPGSFVGTFEAEGAGNPLIDNVPFSAPAGPPTALGVVDGPFGPLDLRLPFGMSNAILATADVTDSGVPIAVFGPQTGYFTPQLLVETDIHAPGIDARGTAFAGTNIYVQLGRGRDYAWSATSASGDLVDEWAVELCDPEGGEATIDSTGYLWDGVCAEIPILTHTQVAKPSAGGIPSGPDIVLDFEIGRIPELNDAPVVGRAIDADGTPVAIAEQRSTFKAELASAKGFYRINNPEFMTDGAESFNRAFDGVDYTFNWFYIDGEDIAYRHTCLCPIRDDRTDPDLLTWAGRGYAWTGDFLPPVLQPQEVNPDAGFFANWNNKQARGFRSQDDSWKHHSTDRRDHLAVRMEAAIAAGEPLTRGDMVNIAEDAGTVDHNPQEIYPLALEVMGEDPPADAGADLALLRSMRDELADWIAVGGHRRDLDRDGDYDHAVAVSIGDAWVRPLVQRVLGDEVPLADVSSASSEDPGGSTETAWPEGTEDHPRQGLGSAYNSGRMRFLQKDFWQVLGRPMEQERSRTYCGDGTLDGCADALWRALADAAELLSSAYEGEAEVPCGFPGAYQFGTDDPAEWVYNADCDDIIQGAAGVVAAPPMRWVNRPTFHQVAEPGTISGRIDGTDRIATAAAVSRHAFPDGAATAVLAGAGTFADAVAGTPLAASLDAPILLTDQGRLSAATERELLRLGVEEVVVLGGAAAVAQAVVARLDTLEISSRRVAGDTRYDTAAAIAAELGVTDRFVLANAGTFADALAAGPFAAVDGRAILLSDADTLAAAAEEAMGEATDVIIAGGEAAISAGVADAVAADGATVARRSGDDRYTTAASFTQAAIDAGADATLAYAVTGEAFPDALAAGSVAARTNGVLVLLHPDGLDLAEGASVLTGTAARVFFVGGAAALPSAVRQELERLT